MAEKFSVDIDAIRPELSVLKSGMETFKGYSGQFLKESAGSLDDMNSDFVSKIQKVLKNMKDSRASRLMAEIEGYVTVADAVVRGFETMDDEMSDRLMEGSK